MCENQLCFYVSYLANEGLAHQTIKSYLSAVRHLQISYGYPDPHIGDMPRLEQVLKGIKSSQVRQGKQPRKRLPITPSILRQIRRVWEQESSTDYNCIMLWAACTLCFFGFFRAGEITVPTDMSFDAGAHLTFADIAIDSKENPSVMEIRLKASKTDPYRKGISIYVGRTGNALCPISAMLAYLAVRGDKEGPLFQFYDGRSLTRERFVQAIRKALTKAGFDHQVYAGHSFRIGAATTAAHCGIPDSVIQTLGRWQSSAYLLYIRTPREHLANITSTLSKSRS